MPAVAYAIGRRAGNAVARNRIRRRLRAAVHDHREQLVPGAAYLLGADATVTTVPYQTLSGWVAQVLAEADPR